MHMWLSFALKIDWTMMLWSVWCRPILCSADARIAAQASQFSSLQAALIHISAAGLHSEAAFASSS